MNNRTKMGSVRMSILLSILMALSGMAAIALADDPGVIPPNKFSGTVTLNGADASHGTVINAYIVGELRGSIVVETAGEYVQLEVNGDASDDGKNITFTVCGATADQTAKWYKGDPVQPPRVLDLTAVDDEAPEVTDATATPPSIVANGTDTSQLTVNVTDGCTVGDVTVNLSEIGGPDAQVMEFSGDGVYSTDTNASTDTPPGTYYLYVNASDVFGKCNTSVYIELTITRACGDVDPNEGLDARDVAHLAGHVAGISGYETLYGDGDVDPNEGLDARDVAHLACHVAGISGYETLHC